jgi:hypothetical protein
MSKVTKIDPERLQRFREGLVMQEIEDNPLAPDEIVMFEMFHREGWSDERRRAYLTKLEQDEAASDVAAE